MPEIISRQEAMARGLKRYFTGVPCPHGHAAERFVGDCHCRTCAALKLAQWSKKNSERVTDYHREKYRNNRIRINQREKKRREANPEKAKLIAQKTYAKHIEKRREENRIHKAKNREYYREYQRVRERKITDLLAVLRTEMPDLLKEFDL